MVFACGLRIHESIDTSRAVREEVLLPCLTSSECCHFFENKPAFQPRSHQLLHASRTVGDGAFDILEALIEEDLSIAQSCHIVFGNPDDQLA